MPHDFDNTIDSILRRAAAGERESVALSENFSASSEHLEPDEIAAFAENAVPPKARLRYLQHFADCDNCRRFLATFAATESEEIESVTENAVEIAPTPISWTQRFAAWFALPNLGYAMAALTVLLIGAFAFVAVRSRQESSSPTVARVEQDSLNKQETKISAAPQPTQPSETGESQLEPPATNNASANSSSANTSVTQPENPAAGEVLPPSVRATREQANIGKDSRVAGPEVVRSEENTITAAPADNSNAPAVAMAPPPAPQPAKPVNVATADQLAQTKELEAKTDAKVDRDAEDDIKIKDEAATELARRAPEMAAGASQPEVTRSKKQQAVETRNVGGRTFARQNGIWTDAAYKGQTTISVSRNSDEFRNLDAGLRAIAQSLNGTILVVWRDGKAYRIQ